METKQKEVSENTYQISPIIDYNHQAKGFSDDTRGDTYFFSGSVSRGNSLYDNPDSAKTATEPAPATATQHVQDDPLVAQAIAQTSNLYNKY